MDLKVSDFIHSLNLICDLYQVKICIKDLYQEKNTRNLYICLKLSGPVFFVFF